MKNLLYKIIGSSFLLFLTFSLSAQKEHKVSMSTGKVIIIEVDKVDIVGYNGSEVIIIGQELQRKKDKRSEGLMVISGTGKQDNTGFGLSATKSGSELTIEQVSKQSKGRVTIKVPKKVAVEYDHDTHSGSELNIDNVSSEIEISAHFNNVKLKNVTGPMSINTVHGDIEASFSSVSQLNPITLRSSHGLIDVTMPASTTADLKLKSSHGDMFTDFDIKVAEDSSNDRTAKSGNGCNSCPSDKKITGQINGGGVLVDIRSNHNNIYFRKKK